MTAERLLAVAAVLDRHFMDHTSGVRAAAAYEILEVLDRMDKS